MRLIKLICHTHCTRTPTFTYCTLAFASSGPMAAWGNCRLVSCWLMERFASLQRSLHAETPFPLRISLFDLFIDSTPPSEVATV